MELSGGRVRRSRSFVGLQNYATALSDPRFLRAVAFTVVLTLIVTAILVVFGYIIATLVNQLGKLRPVVLGILLVSYVLPTSSVRPHSPGCSTPTSAG